jgi:alpha-glucosidase
MAMMIKSLILFFLFAGPAAAETQTQAVITGPSGARLRVEALDSRILRLWLKPSGEFVRQSSLAMETAPTGRVPLSVDQGAIRTADLSVKVDPKTLAFSILSREGKAIIPDALIQVSTSGAWTMTYALSKADRIFGLGQDNRNNGRLDRRGVIRDLWAGQQIQSGNVTAQYPVPLLLCVGPRGAYGIFFDNVHHMRFDLGKTKSGTMRLDADGGEIDLYVLAGPRLADVIERYTSLTGRPSLPPLWALGYWQSKCTYWDWKALDEAYDQLNQRGFPVDVMVIDADWPEIVTDYQWAKRWFPEGGSPADKIADYAKKGVKIVMSQSGPMVKAESPTFKSGWDLGVFATDGKGNPVEAGYYGGKLLDFTHPRMDAWLWPQTRKLNEQGTAGWWLDLDEPEGEPPQTVYYGGRPADIHNQYSLLCTRSFEGVQLAVHPDQRPFILSRAASAGSQRHHEAVWTGDIYSDYATLRAHPPEMLNSGLSGLPYWTCDTGGFLVGDYKNDRFGAHARLYERWMQFSTFSPITRAHKAGGVPEPYALGPAAEQGNKHYLQLRYRLLPYIYSYAWEASQKGLPLVRPLALEYQDDPGSLAAAGDEYLFGRELLVAPVLHEGQVNRSVYFPPGKWYDWDTGLEYQGGRVWVVSAPQNRIPVAVRAGAIIPMAPDMKNTASGAWDPITLEVYPSGKSSFTLYRDDGATFAYQKGRYTTTSITSEADDSRVRLVVEESNKDFVPKKYLLRLHLVRKPVSVSGASDWSWDDAARVLSAGLPDEDSSRHQVEVSLGEALPARLAPSLKAQAIDPKAEAAGNMGRPMPHFFPPPALPARFRAVNYDKGGEGIAFHSARPMPAKGLYRDDAFAIAATNDAGGGFVLSALRPEEWARYTIDGGNGGYFDLTARAASAAGAGRLRLMSQDQVAAQIDVPATGGDDEFKDVLVPGVYLNPGEQTLMAYVDKGGFSLASLDLRPAKSAPSVYPAVLASRRGVAEIAGRGDAGRPQGFIRNLGRVGSGLDFGVVAGAAGAQTLRMSYTNGLKKPVALSLTVGKGPALNLDLPPTEGQWRPFDVPVRLESGANRVSLSGREEGWDNIQFESLELVAPKP